MRSKTLALFIVGMSFLILGGLQQLRERHRLHAPLPVLGTIPNVELVESSGSAFELGSLAGRPWVLNLFYTTCDGPCPQTSGRIAALQSSLPDVRFVSLSINPSHDTPERLQEYAKKFSAHAEQWIFLTGEEKRIRALVTEALRMANQDSIEIHSTRLVLVDDAMRIRGLYDSADPQSVERMQQAYAELSENQR